ncbi:MAG: hypothetical protein HKO79_07220 [Desulfobacterales bacterium]|nr:hypothetical protein [Desulfobacterales bacterium]
MNMHTVAAWSVMVGAYSDFILETVSNDLDILEEALRNDKYRQLRSNLQNYIINYKTKVLVSTGKKDAYSTDIDENTIKFNQMWNVSAESEKDHEEYARYVMEEYYPLLEDLGILVAGEWEVLIGDGPHLICEGRVNDVPNLIRNLQGAKFRKAKKKLKNYTSQYQSRILAFHIQKVKGYKSASYQIVRG